MPEKSQVKMCKEPHCKVHIDGKCMDALDLEKGECLNFYLDDENTVNEQTSKSVLQPKKNPGIPLYNGEEMDAHGTDQVTHKHRVKVIAIVGESECGKTTLLAEIYNIFQRGANQDLVFAGSQTLIGFEKRSHFSKVESNSENPETGKTISREFGFLHLSLKKTTALNDDPVHILLSDISGERFQLARDSSSVMKELKLLTDADQVIFIIDGERLATKRLRQQTLLNAETFIQSALDNSVLNIRTNLKVIVSKWDMLINDTTFDFTMQVELPFTEKFASRVKTINIKQIAARPKAAVISSGYGLYELLNDCYLVSRDVVVKGPRANVRNNPREFHQIKSQVEL